MKRLEPSEFGANVWLLEEMYQQYLEDPASVSGAWREFFEDYQPRQSSEVEDGGSRPEGTQRTPRRAAAVAPQASEQAAPRASEQATLRKDPESAPEVLADSEGQASPLRGAAAVMAKRMEESLSVPTATSVRLVPARLLEINRTILNRHLSRHLQKKVSFTHLIGWAVVKALVTTPAMNRTFRMIVGRPHVVRHDHVNLGLAVDVKRPDGARTLVVPNIKRADTVDFAAFVAAYDELIRKVNTGNLAPDDFSGTTVTVTNPGTIGTVASIPRLMADQAAIIGVGSIDYPAAFAGADPDTLAEIGVGKVLTLTSTYDHRIIQGAESGELLGHIHRLLLGEDGFYDEVFASMGVAYVPVRWRQDRNPAPDTVEAHEKHARVLQLINMYRVRGHLIADLDPLAAKPPRMHPELDPATYGLSIWDLDRKFVTQKLAGHSQLSLGEILAILRDAYCRTFTVEYMHVQEPEEKVWIQRRVEGVSPEIASEDMAHILHKLDEAEAFERFLHQRYVGHKRFSLEGAEALIPMLDAILERATEAGLVEVVMGMSHRGRLNVLANTIGKSYAQIFHEFEGNIDPLSAQGSGDVKYHLGATGKHTSRSGRDIIVTLASNPSHLESVDPVVEGMARAKQDLLSERPRGIQAGSGEAGPEASPVLPILMHGDAAFAGQGVVAETLALSQLSGYRTRGTIHIIVNNQLGFTTGSSYARSSTYASDVAKMVLAPIFHVNGDDPEACVRAARLAFEFRRDFRKDVVIDMWCYRRWGHNEADDPSFTQPLMYAAIEARRSVRKLYTETLVTRGDLSLEEAERSLSFFQERLAQALNETRGPSATARIEWKRPAPLAIGPIETGVDRTVLEQVLQALTTTPEGFHLHPKLARWLQTRHDSLGQDAVDWSLAEALALGSLLLEEITIRLTGQDTRRGTFSQRHCVLVDQKTAEEYIPLSSLGEGRARFFVCDSLLSEMAAVGFEYGYSVANPDALVIWEAQFGDFANGAQVIIDQYLSVAEDKWGQTSGLVLLLPHGYEGQGPEHSSARLERFCQLGGEDNHQVVVPSTPAQYFHLLRRQVRRAVRKPLIVATPKSLLRLPAARSSVRELTSGHFRDVLADPTAPKPSGVRRVILCCGKLYYELARFREERRLEEVALVRLEQLYPFPVEALRACLEPFGAGAPSESPPGAQIWWVQEEPVNMGAWRHVQVNARERLGIDLEGVTREESASPATGSLTIHQLEQAALLERAFAGL